MLSGEISEYYSGEDVRNLHSRSVSVPGVVVTRGTILTERGPKVNSALKMFKVFCSDLNSRL